MNVVLDRLAAGDNFHFSGALELRLRVDEVAQSFGEVGAGAGDIAIEPELDARGLRAGRLQQLDEDVLLAVEQVAGEAQAVDEGDVKEDVDADGCALLDVHGGSSRQAVRQVLLHYPSAASFSSV